jgi:transposase-like protein
MVPSMADKTRPTTRAGQALAAWNRRSRTMAETIARIEQQAVEDWLASDQTNEALAAVLSTKREWTENDASSILEALRGGGH